MKDSNNDWLEAFPPSLWLILLVLAALWFASDRMEKELLKDLRPAPAATASSTKGQP